MADAIIHYSGGPAHSNSGIMDSCSVAVDNHGDDDVGPTLLVLMLMMIISKVILKVVFIKTDLNDKEFHDFWSTLLNIKQHISFSHS